MTLLDRPYRRLVDAIPLRYVGFTVPDELFVGYGFELDERWRALAAPHLERFQLHSCVAPEHRPARRGDGARSAEPVPVEEGVPGRR